MHFNWKVRYSSRDLLTKCASTDGIMYAWIGTKPSIVLFIAIRMFSTILADVSGPSSGSLGWTSLFKKLFDIENTTYQQARV